MDERKSNAALVEKSEAEIDALREDLNGQISRLRAEHDEKVANLESRLEVALGKTDIHTHTDLRGNERKKTSCLLMDGGRKKVINHAS